MDRETGLYESMVKRFKPFEDRRILSSKPKGKWIGKRIKRYSQPIYSIGQAALTARRGGF